MNTIRLSKPSVRSIPAVVLKELQWTRPDPPLLPQSPSILATNLIKSYFEKGSIKEARNLFDEMPERDIVAWTTMIAGYTSCNYDSLAWRMFYEMLNEGVTPNAFTVSIVLKACKGMKYYSCGALVHGLATKHGLVGSVYVDNSLIDVYATCSRSMDEACMVFHDVNPKTEVSWTTLIAGYTHRGDGYGGLRAFQQMFSQIHSNILRKGLDRNLALANSLIDMYAKCGSISDSRKIFELLSFKDLVSWTSMMIACGVHGRGTETIKLFNEMVRSGIRPDRVVFMAVLIACSHAGLVNEGLRYFNSMLKDYNIIPDQDIYGCVVDLLGRAGKIEAAYELIKNMGVDPNDSVWGALFGSCKAHKLPNLGKLASKFILEARPDMARTYLMLSNLYASEGEWKDFAKMRKLMKGMGGKKEPGCSWIELKNDVYSFVVGDKVGPQTEGVYEVLSTMALHMEVANYCLDDPT